MQFIILAYGPVEDTLEREWVKIQHGRGGGVGEKIYI